MRGAGAGDGEPERSLGIEGDELGTLGLEPLCAREDTIGAGDERELAAGGLGDAREYLGWILRAPRAVEEAQLHPQGGSCRAEFVGAEQPSDGLAHCNERNREWDLE